MWLEELHVKQLAKCFPKINLQCLFLPSGIGPMPFFMFGCACQEWKEVGGAGRQQDLLLFFQNTAPNLNPRFIAFSEQSQDDANRRP